ncbi:MAG: SDR family NAD(P)-dependent oxidoreductase [Oscillospiraceae bacterium]|nr:SDR family NAD(P)-dependent oxidoreductase [Oscillospiraceae bacterium]
MDMSRVEANNSVHADAKAAAVAPVLRMCYAAAAGTGAGAGAVIVYLGEEEPRPGQRVCIIEPGDIGLDGSAPGDPLSETDIATFHSALKNEFLTNGCGRVAVYVPGVGMFACGADIDAAIREAVQALQGSSAAYFRRQAQAIKYMAMATDDINSNGAADNGRMKGKIVLVTGAAQGFGKGIAEGLAAEGAYVAVADMNYEGAKACAEQICKICGAGRAIAVHANVTDEESVAAMVRETVLSYGGLDLFISNAGVLIAGALPDMSKKDFELVTSVNYTGYFLGAKHASAPMKIQRAVNGQYMSDIIEINSKSGLEGSNKNFAYAGSKFGGIGLTQSFALELVEYGIKVNAICPGNFLDGPLWSDPDRGLFKQYLEAGKVPGAKTVGDVRRYYESRVPMKRGCTVGDVVKAILYLVDQKYETGQALPVTGGQVMLS